jgi:peptide/nickel transport system substrate-binding protein
LTRSLLSRWRLAAPIVVLAALVCTAAAIAASARHAAGSTLVVDNSFTIKTADPQRAFDPTASIVDRGIFDTLFTYAISRIRSRCSSLRGRQRTAQRRSRST